MIIYELSIDDVNATELTFPIESERERFVLLAKEKISNSISVKDEWEEFLVLKEEPKVDMDFYDIEDLGIIILSQRAFDLVSPSLNETIEVLKLRSDDEDFYLLNVIHTTDCFDKDNAQYTALEFDDSEQIIDYQVLSFFPEKIKCPIFRMPELPYTVLITDDIMQIYYLNGLKGLSLSDNEYVWNEY